MTWVFSSHTSDLSSHGETENVSRVAHFIRIGFLYETSFVERATSHDNQEASYQITKHISTITTEESLNVFPFFLYNIVHIIHARPPYVFARSLKFPVSSSLTFPSRSMLA